MSTRFMREYLAAFGDQKVRDHQAPEASGRRFRRTITSMLAVILIAAGGAAAYQLVGQESLVVGGASSPIFSDGNAYTAQLTLDAIVNNDRPRVEPLLDRWTPVVLSIKKGLVVDGAVMSASDILAKIQGWKQTYPKAVVVDSSEYTSFRSDGFYVVLIPPSYPAPEDANEWCVHAYLAPSDCYAKRVSRTADPGSSSVMR